MPTFASRVNSQLARSLGVCIARTETLRRIENRLMASDHARSALADRVEHLQSLRKTLTNSPVAIRRICSIGQLLRPQRALGYRKVRLGGPHDGGYVCLDDFEGVAAALSLGLGDDVSWDSDVANRGLIVHQYDHTVAAPPAEHANFRFHRRKIAAVADDDSETIESALSRNFLTAPASVLLKIDIEHDEWAVFDATADSALDKFSQMTCEFHGFDRVANDDWFATANSVLAKLAGKFAVVHVHANNAEPLLELGNLLFPQLLEVTFASRAKYRFSDTDEVFPTELDSPNLATREDYNLGNFVYPKS